MAGALQHLRSSTLNKRPNPASMVDGQIAINYASGSPGAFFKDSNGNLVKVGPVHVGATAPNVSPASGGTAGNSLGEQWLDTSGGTYVFKIWDGSAWRSETGTFVDVNGDTMTGALGIVTGSASTPGLFFSGDTNTGIYSPGADQVAISTNGTGRLFIDSAGRIGAGVSSPGYPFDLVSQSGESIRIRGTSGTDVSKLLFTSNTAGADYGYLASASGYLAFGYGASERVRIDSSGRLGVGTTVPAERFSVNDSSSNAAILIRTGGVAFNSVVKFNADDTNYAGIGLENTALVMRCSNSSTPTERARIDSSGRLLVGTSSDSGGALLQVNGNRVRIATAKTPASASDTGTTGEICWDASYIYVCTATNTWKRAALSTW